MAYHLSTNVAAVLGNLAGGLAAVRPAVGGKGGSGVLDNANYAQKTYSNTFSAEGRKIYSDLAGEPINTIDDLVNAINSGKVNVADLPVEYIVRDGNTLILNTRTSQALTQEGISTVRPSGGQ